MSGNRHAQLEAKFRRLTRDRLAAMSRRVVEVEYDDATQAAETVEALARELHTLKGEARLLGFGMIADIAHRLEAHVQSARDSGLAADDTFVAEMLDGLDAIGQHLERTARDQPQPSASPKVETAITDLRIEAARLTRLAENATELSLAHGRWAALLAELEDLTDLVDATVEARIRHIVARAKEQSRATEATASDLLDGVKQLQMVPLAVGLARYPRAVRDLALEQHKRVRLSLDVGSVQIDRQILEALDEPLLHLLSNAVDHGCEPPDERREANKTEVATVRIHAKTVGSSLELVIADDGRGVSLEDVTRAAHRRGVVDDDASLKRDELLRLVFRPGFTTRTDVTQTSGRGVGLDVVERAVERLGGSVGLDSSPGKGTTVTLRVPVSSIVVNALAVRIGDVECAIPIEAVVEVMGMNDTMVEEPGDALALRYEDALVPLRDLAALIGLPGRSTDGHVVIVEHAKSRFGVLVDRVLGERQILHRSKGAFLAGSRTLRDVGVSNDGATMVVLEPAALAEPVARPIVRDVEAAGRRDVLGRVLVVDDSELTRDLLANLARDHGHEVIEAVDGEDALTKINQHAPDVIVTDLEMPLLDGFGLLHRLRESAELRDIPVVVLSTRGEREDIRRAAELGAAAYVVKSELDADRLGRILERLVAAPRVDG